MGSKMGVHSTRARRSAMPLVSSIRHGWSSEVHCPGCGVVAVDRDQEKIVELGVNTRFYCPDLRCVFHYGWRLDMTDKTEPIVVIEERDDGDNHIIRARTTRQSRMMIAVPLTIDGDRIPTRAAPWPRPASVVAA